MRGFGEHEIFFRGAPGWVEPAGRNPSFHRWVRAGLNPILRVTNDSAAGGLRGYAVKLDHRPRSRASTIRNPLSVRWRTHQPDGAAYGRSLALRGRAGGAALARGGGGAHQLGDLVRLAQHHI